MSVRDDANCIWSERVRTSAFIDQLTKVWVCISMNEAIVFSAYWSAYQAVTPSEQHRPVGKETGETAHSERWNNTLRQQLARFVRKTLSFPNCIKMHEIFLKLFIHRSNTELLPIVG